MGSSKKVLINFSKAFKEEVIRTNQTTISENITIGTTAGAEFANGMSSGPITIANGYTITIESTGSWSVV